MRQGYKQVGNQMLGFWPNKVHNTSTSSYLNPNSG
jgi:hypothetical protein